MGVHPLIDMDTYPVQSELVGKDIDVAFPSGETVKGLVVRDDVNFPQLNRRIIQLNDDRYLLQQTTDSDRVRAIVLEEGRPLDECDNPVFANGGYPKQGGLSMKRTEVVFKYDTSRHVIGTIARFDIEEPFEAIIALDDGRWVLPGECQHSPQNS